MRTNLLTLLRALVDALAVGFAAAPAADAGWRTTEPTATARARRETLWGVPRDDPAIAVGAIVGGLALVILFAWVAARLGDKA
jgi:hypothetical protein